MDGQEKKSISKDVLAKLHIKNQYIGDINLQNYYSYIYCNIQELRGMLDSFQGRKNVQIPELDLDMCNVIYNLFGYRQPRNLNINS